MYFNRLKHSKIVISDFQLAKLENGLIKDPCGTPEYLGRSLESVKDSNQTEVCSYNTVMVETPSHLLSAPEVVARQRYGRPVDCWAIGVIMYIL